MEPATLLQLKNLTTLWLLAGNGLFAVAAGVLYMRRQPPTGVFFNALVFLQALILLQAAIGIYLMTRGFPAHPGHLLYGILNALMVVVRLGAHPRLVAGGANGALIHGLMALLVLGLVARASVTAFH